MELGEDPVMVALAAITVCIFLSGLAYVLHLVFRRPRPARGPSAGVDASADPDVGVGAEPGRGP